MTKAAQKPFPRVQSQFEKMMQPYRGHLIDILAMPGHHTVRAIDPRKLTQPVALAVYRDHEDAVYALDRAMKELKRQERKCIPCGRKFMSDGPGNRMCPNCRPQAHDAGQAYSIGRVR